MRVAVVDPGCQAPYYVGRLTRALAGSGCDVSLHTAPHLYEERAQLDGKVEVRRSFGRLLDQASGSDAWAVRHPVPRRLLRAATYPFEVAAFDQWCRRMKPDVVHLQWALAPPLDGAWLRAFRRTGIGTVYSAHNVVPHERRPWHPAFHRWLHGAAARVIVHSRSTRARLVDLGGARADAVRVVPMAADEPDAVPSRDEARSMLDPPIGPALPLALFFGHVRPYKGLDLLLDAAPLLRAKVPSAAVLVCGPVRGGAAEVRRLRDDIARRGMADAVDLRPGYASSATGRACLAAADVVVLPYRAASDSAVLAAARGHGRAVVATDVGSLAESLQAGGGIVVPQGDPGRLADALAEILGHSGIRERLEQEARRAALAWTWRDVAEATLEVYREVVAEASR